jgi:5-formyltetrahydrofolate cyclo-ligase
MAGRLSAVPLTPAREQPAEAKAVLRARLRAARRDRPGRRCAADAEALARVALAVPGVRAARTVACFCSAGAEPGTGPLREALRGAGVRVLLPAVRGGGVLDWAVDDGATVPGFAGIPEPVGPRLGPAALASCDVVLVPALAADTAGGRLGQGGGYYDRSLASARPSGVVAAVVFDAELFDAATAPLPTEPHDVRVDAVLTPGGWVEVPAGRHGGSAVGCRA